MSEVTVWSDVPLPPVDRRPKNPRRKYPLGTMGVGDVIFLPHRNKRTVGAYIHRAAKAFPDRRFEVRGTYGRLAKGVWVPCEAHDAGAVAGAGVWRVE